MWNEDAIRLSQMKSALREVTRFYLGIFHFIPRFESNIFLNNPRKDLHLQYNEHELIVLFLYLKSET